MQASVWDYTVFDDLAFGVNCSKSDAGRALRFYLIDTAGWRPLVRTGGFPAKIRQEPGE
jgi:hypothetical protein